ncbi:hypothetical protein Tco_0537321 [Tanacetum coccineum]
MEKGFLTPKGRGCGKGVKEKQGSSVHDPVDMFEASCGNINDVNTDNVNMETPLELNKGDDVNPNDNVELMTSNNQKAHIMELKRRYFKDYYSDYQYAVSIEKDTAYKCMHSPKTTKGTSSIRRIQRRPIRHIKDIVCEDSGRYQTWSLLQETPIRHIQSIGYAIILIRASRLKKVMADKGKKSSMETFAPNDKADYYSGITSITVNGKNAYELKGKFLDDLHNNAFSGANGKDAVKHIEYYLKIIDLIKLPNVDHDKLRVVVFPISLAGGARRWFDRIKESITCWVDLTAKKF